MKKLLGAGLAHLLAICIVLLFSSVAAFAFTDADRDRMDDDWEIAHGLNPTVRDARGDVDHDGLKNRKEFLKGTNPQSEDTDQDGSDDKDEQKFHTVATNPDTDGDGILDGDEDTDGDGTFDEDEDDAKEKCVNNDGSFSTPDDDDTDQDGLADEDENDFGTDPQDADSDDDGIVDGNDDANQDGIADEDEDDGPNGDLDDRDKCQDGGEDADDPSGN